jgi:hypothetical protein
MPIILLPPFSPCLIFISARGAILSRSIDAAVRKNTGAVFFAFDAEKAAKAAEITDSSLIEKRGMEP